MATLNIKNFPDTLYQTLQQRADRDRRSLAQEIIHLLERVVEVRGSRSIMELEGLGKECWEGIDPVSYVREERDSWDS